MTQTADPVNNADLKTQVHDFWNANSCGEVYAVGDSEAEAYDAQAATRYALEPFIARFAKFHEGAGKKVLEVGVGMGADHTQWMRSAPARLVGVDLTPRAIGFTRKRCPASSLSVADAEVLPLPSEAFDIVYSWGVIHHSPDTPRCVAEIHRVLRPGGVARVMIYHTSSIVGFMLWARYALLAGRPSTSMREIYSRYLESPGTKAYSLSEARELFRAFSSFNASIELSPGDLFTGEAGQRHNGVALKVLRRIWPRGIVKKVFRQRGLFLLIEARK